MSCYPIGYSQYGNLANYTNGAYDNSQVISQKEANFAPYKQGNLQYKEIPSMQNMQPLVQTPHVPRVIYPPQMHMPYQKKLNGVPVQQQNVDPQMYQYGMWQNQNSKLQQGVSIQQQTVDNSNEIPKDQVYGFKHYYPKIQQNSSIQPWPASENNVYTNIVQQEQPTGYVPVQKKKYRSKNLYWKNNQTNATNIHRKNTYIKDLNTVQHSQAPVYSNFQPGITDTHGYNTYFHNKEIIRPQIGPLGYYPRENCYMQPPVYSYGVQCPPPPLVSLFFFQFP